MRAALRDVGAYSARFLHRNSDGIHIPVTYRASWNDGFGARGWKLDAAIGDPEIIASTRETGLRLPTSVFVHDIVDHLLCGFAPSGHRAEAMALVQLAQRTGSDPTPDFRQMVEEDILAGRVLGEDWHSFLPADLLALLPAEDTCGNKAMARLERQLGRETLIGHLVGRFFKLGHAGDEHTRESCKKLSLEASNRRELGLALQQVIAACDGLVEAAAAEFIEAVVTVSASGCAMTLGHGRPADLTVAYRVRVG